MQNGKAATEAKAPNRIAPVQLRKVAIIGKAPSSVRLAPYDDPTWEIWVLNTLGHGHEVPRWDRQFEIHDLELTKDRAAYGDYYDWLKAQSHGERPVIVRDVVPDDWGRAARAFPREELKKAFADLPALYITNTVSWMIALALLEHKQGQCISDLGMWGVDMAQHQGSYGHAGHFASEYARQRPSCEWWVGIAAGMGIKVHIPGQSDLLKSPCLYGDHTDEMWAKRQARRKELEARVNNARVREQQAHDEAIYLSGALEGENYHSQNQYQGRV